MKAERKLSKADKEEQEFSGALVALKHSFFQCVSRSRANKAEQIAPKKLFWREVKVDWIPATDFNPALSCTEPPAGVHMEVIDGACYAMAGMHISSKLLNNWLWATFEPQSMLTNPLRCITFGACNDPWGSIPATRNGGANGFTKPTPALQALMAEGKLAPEFLNYRLNGVQIDFVNPDKTPTYLGNSIIEGENAGMKKDTASCITCHSISSIKKDGADGFSIFISLRPQLVPNTKFLRIGSPATLRGLWDSLALTQRVQAYNIVIDYPPGFSVQAGRER